MSRIFQRGSGPFCSFVLCTLAGCSACDDASNNLPHERRVNLSTLAPIMVVRHASCPVTTPVFETPLRAMPRRMASGATAAAE